ncbi:hypothetical protein P691DRAFT_806189 [Macrolepiota fuliginosa MF-IS2]|uniref:Uncharacterized protein n=1 Tax=Macrolepiota fuliginosa MF-IS2 TaxID=1400762 RepID=A0A9P6C169_9AGAR|nr:hypothetical protein P691DRAFT_806189 [Macrolepiota fuliginosa MF-IS2]
MKLSAPADNIGKPKPVVRLRVFRNCQLAFPKWLILASIDNSLAAQLTGFDFKAWWDHDIGQFNEVSQLEALISKIPPDYRGQIIRLRKRVEPALISWFKDSVLPKRWRSRPIYVLGQGKKSVLLKVGQDERVTRIHR